MIPDPKVIKLKIIGYDDETESLLIKFACDLSDKSIDEYEAYAFQPKSYSEFDPQKILEWIAKSGIYNVSEQIKSEKWEKSNDSIEVLKSLEGQEFEYDVDYLNKITEHVVIQHHTELSASVDSKSEETYTVIIAE